MRSIGRCLLGHRREALALGILVAGLLVAGCAYFNTFYHARKFYNEAERKRKEAEEQGRPATDAYSSYEQSIKKCAKIIVEYPDSKWVDDALLMMGNGFYYREEYMRAIRKYEELIAYYPESPFVAEARWMNGLARYGMGEVEEAREIFRQVAGGPEDSEWRAQATVMLARSWEDDGKYKRCIAEVEDVFGSGEDSEASAAAFVVLGDCYRRLGDLTSAIRMYERAADRSENRAERFEAELRVAEGLTSQGRLEEAQEFYEILMDKESNVVRQAKLRLAMGHLLVTRGDVEEGIEMFREVAEDPLIQNLPGEAQLQIGLAYERGLGDFEEAVKAYEAVARKRPPPEIGEEASRRRDSVTRMIGYLDRREEAPPDSVGLLDFLIAEHYLFSVEDPSKAKIHYQAVADDSTNETLSAKSLLALAWIQGRIEGDTTAALGFYQEVVDRYPETEHADEARVVLGLPPRPKPEPVDTLSVVPPDSVGFEPGEGQMLPDSLLTDRMPVRPDSASAVPLGELAGEGSVHPGPGPEGTEPARPDSLELDAEPAKPDSAMGEARAPIPPAQPESSDEAVEDSSGPLPEPEPETGAAGVSPDSLMGEDRPEDPRPSGSSPEEDHEETPPDSLKS